HRVLQFQHELRPTAAEIAEELEALHDAMEGPTLGRWARSREWPQQILEGAELEGKSIDTDGQVVSPSQVPPPPRTPTPPPAPPPALGGASSVVPMDARNVSPGKVPSPAAPPPRQTPAPERPAARPPPPPPPPSRSPVMMIGVGIVVLVVLGVLVSVLLAVLAAALYVVA
ncbi:MAG: hypothetical protein KC621_27055, partial [Myxococcales bacterium]|nr:hypothetical protein [Myxococcales bacterium]